MLLKPTTFNMLSLAGITLVSTTVSHFSESINVWTTTYVCVIQYVCLCWLCNQLVYIFLYMVGIGLRRFLAYCTCITTYVY